MSLTTIDQKLDEINGILFENNSAYQMHLAQGDHHDGCNFLVQIKTWDGIRVDEIGEDDESGVMDAIQILFEKYKGEIQHEIQFN